MHQSRSTDNSDSTADSRAVDIVPCKSFLQGDMNAETSVATPGFGDDEIGFRILSLSFAQGVPSYRSPRPT